MNPLLEVCCGSLTNALTAHEAGAQRIELCTALSIDGLTPSMSVLHRLRQRFPDWTIHVLIRCREGGFVYSTEEVEVMADEIRSAVAIGCDGIVCGALTPNRDIDLAALQLWMEAAEGLPVTFHRAFDEVREPNHALEQLITFGVRRVLTSGGCLSDGSPMTAEQGIPQLRKLIQQADGRIIILPGGGVNSQNARRILQETGASEIHGSCSRLHPNGLRETDLETVRDVLEAIRG
ncbi:MAG: copper homeostasis protein CutC [Bacteroidaceae bacterium]|nr:copper homeostasis protein CutC [Bacteroidaceae bacterium]